MWSGRTPTSPMPMTPELWRMLKSTPWNLLARKPATALYTPPMAYQSGLGSQRTRAPHMVLGVARDVHVRGNAERVAAERQVLRVAVEGRGGEVIEAIDAPSDDAEPAAKERLGHGEMNEPGRLAAEDLLDRVDVADVLGRQAASGPVRGRHQEGGVVEQRLPQCREAATEQLLEIGKEGEADVVGVGDPLALAADRIAG